MKGITQKVLIPLLAAHAIAILGLLLYFLVAGDRAILPEFAWSWIYQAIIVSWIDFFIPITVTGFLLGFSVFISTTELRSLMKGDRSFVRIAGKSVVLVLVVALVFVALTAFLYGNARQQRDTLHDRSIRAHAYLLDAQILAKRGQKGEAAELVGKALLIAPKYLAAMEFQSRLLSGSDAARPEVVIPLGDDSGEPKAADLPKNRLSLVYEDNLNSAREYLDRGDVYSALYFVRKAEELTSRPDRALIDIRTEAEKKIRNSGISEEDQHAKEVFAAKQRAIVDYYQNNRPVEAYYQLLEVEAMEAGKAEGTAAKAAAEAGSTGAKKEYRDPDVRRWMPEVLAQLERNTFFREEAEPLVAEATGAGVMFVNREEAGVREYVYAQAVLQGRFNQYLLSPEVIVVSTDGKVQSHRVSAFGKIVGTNLIMKSIGQASPDKVDEVRILAGRVDQDIRNVVRLHQSPEVIRNLSQSRFGYQDMSFPELVALLDVVPKAGYDVLPLQAVMLGYFLQVLSLPSLCFFAIGWGWSNRNRYLTRPVLLTGLMILAVPILLFILMKLYQYLGECLNSSLLILTGFETALMVLIVIQAVQLVVSLVYMAGQTTD